MPSHCQATGKAILLTLFLAGRLTSQQPALLTLNLVPDLTLLPKTLKLRTIDMVGLLSKGQFLVGKSAQFLVGKWVSPEAIVADSTGAVLYRIEPKNEVKGAFIEAGLVGDTVWLMGPRQMSGAIFIKPGGMETRDEQATAFRFRETANLSGMSFNLIAAGYALPNSRLVGLGTTRTVGPMGVPPKPGPYLVATGRMGGTATKVIASLANHCERVGKDIWNIERVTGCQPPAMVLSTDGTRIVLAVPRGPDAEASGVDILSLTLTGDTTYSRFIPASSFSPPALPAAAAATAPRSIRVTAMKAESDGTVMLLVVGAGVRRHVLLYPDGRIRGQLPDGILNVERRDELAGASGNIVWVIEGPGTKDGRAVRYRIEG